MSHYAEMFDPMTAADYAALKYDIQRHGILVPIELDENGEVLDGHNRMKIAEELGITDYPTVVRSFPSEQHKELHVIALNLYRRHLGKPKRKTWIWEARQLALELGDEPPPIPKWADNVVPIKRPPSSSAVHATERQRTH